MRHTVKADERTLREVEAMLGDFHKRAPNAISNALNRAMTSVNAAVKKHTREQYIIKAGDIVKYGNLKTYRSTRATLGAKVESTGGPIPLDKFKVSPKTINPRRQSPIKIAVKKSVAPKPVEGAFMADINGPKLFERTGSKRLPIRRLFGPSVPQMIGNEKIVEQIDQIGQETFDKRLEHEIGRILERGRSR